MRHPSQIFSVIVIAQFCGTSLWFAGNAVLPQLQQDFGWLPSHVGYLTSAIQLGFISGTFLYSFLGIPDRFSPSRVFMLSAALAALSNALSLADLSSLPVVMASRVLTGFFLAGVYPVGMKIAADWTEKGLGLWLGALVGALVLGTAFPSLLKEFSGFVQPQKLMLTVSLLALTGGILLYFFVPDGPYRKTGSIFSFRKVADAFQIQGFRRAALGYFGHMWELYAMWAFIPVMISRYTNDSIFKTLSTEIATFLTIGSGALGCLAGGLISRKTGSEIVARYMLTCSGLCCLISSFAAGFTPVVFYIFLFFWGFTIAGDSPQFSTLVAANARPDIRGSAITMVTCLGFFISILSIQLLNSVAHSIPPNFLFLLLAPGPVLGIIAMKRS